MNHIVDFNFLGKSSNEGKLIIIRSDIFMNEMLKNKGKSFTGTLYWLDEKASEPHRGYYFKHVLPLIAKGLLSVGYIEDIEFAEETARQLSPVCWDEHYDENGKLHRELRKIKDLTDKELSFHISFWKMKASVWLRIYINDGYEL